MPVLDSCQPQVVSALVKAGWTVQPDQFLLRIDRRHRVYIDIEAHRSDEETIMLVEVKCFQDANMETTDLYAAIGQYLVYRSLLEQQLIDFPLYLIVPHYAYAGVFQRMALPLIAQSRVRMIVVDLEREVINQWLNW